jgi:hypothetical protein
MSKRLALVFLLVLTAAAAFGLDFSLRPGGFMLIPLGAGNRSEDGEERYSLGGGGDIGFEIDLSGIWPNPPGIGYTLGIEGGLAFTSLKSPAEGNLALYSAGGSLGLYYFPLSRLLTRLDLGLGLYTGVMDSGRTPPALWWRAGGELGFRFTPMFTLAAGGGWRQYRSGNGSGVFNSGIYTGLTLHITFETGGGSNAGGAGAAFTQDDGVYPAFLSLYQKSPVGTITIRNNENAEIRDLRVSFRASGYTASEFPCGTVPLIAKGRSAELPLYADFSPELLRFTDTGRVLGEVVVRYRFLGKEKQSVQTAAVQVYNRNTFPASDSTGLAAFVSPASPEILEYAKHINGLARSSRRTGLNGNMQTAVWLLEGLRAAGIRLDDTHAGEGEVQFPSETLGFRTGNVTDIGLLYAAALEASGIASAIIPPDPERGFGDFVIAYTLGVTEAGAGLLFNGLERVLVIDGEVWMPLSMKAFNEGFMAAWNGGVDALDRSFADGSAVDFIMTEAAWGIYPSAPLPAQGGTGVRAGGETLAQAAERVMGEYINREIQPQIAAVQRQITANPTAALYNRLGILLVRAGRSAEARAAYERAAGMGSVPAMTNRGNLALIEKDYAAAERWFTQALSVQPENGTALRGLEKVSAYRGVR